MGKRELVTLLDLSSWRLVMVGWFFLAVPRRCLQFVIVVFPDHTHLLILSSYRKAAVLLTIAFNHFYFRLCLDSTSLLTISIPITVKYIVGIR